MRCLRRTTLLLLLAVSPALYAQRGNEREIEALAKSAEAFIHTFQKGDAKALAAFWTADGDYTDQAGRQLKGRDAIEKAFTSLFASTKGLKLRIESDSLRFITPDVAIEDGVTLVQSPDGTPPSRVRFSMVHVKQAGQWVISSVRDAPYAPPSNYEHLKVLEFAVGEWAGETGKEVEHLSVAWAENQNFLHTHFSTSVNGVGVGSARQTIAWDPVQKNIRSWVFDATGGFGEAAWSQVGDKWVFKKTSVRADGKRASVTIALSRVDADTLLLRATDATVDGTPIPGVKEVKLKRVR